MTLTFDKAKWSKDDEGYWVHLLIKEWGPAQKFLAAMKAGKQYIADLKQYRAKRSPDANAYYWTLIGALAPALHITSAAAHNLMLRRYGVPEIMAGKLVRLVVPESEDAEQKVMESETYHIKPTSETRTGNDGVTYRTYTLLKGSHAYDSREMSALINGLVDECHAQGIETKTPDELALMMARWKDG